MRFGVPPGLAGFFRQRVTVMHGQNMCSSGFVLRGLDQSASPLWHLHRSRLGPDPLPGKLVRPMLSCRAQGGARRPPPASAAGSRPWPRRRQYIVPENAQRGSFLPFPQPFVRQLCRRLRPLSVRADAVQPELMLSWMAASPPGGMRPAPPLASANDAMGKRACCACPKKANMRPARGSAGVLEERGQYRDRVGECLLPQEYV
ncbi:hypothetical protein C8Q78DRAFT_394051 [Trametes maxima]|nr:hypothetical protein C8Q78DRAFT_394051 [Trametes maxima]